MKIPPIKNGNSGIRNRTKVPKFETLKPTENAKKSENNIQNTNSGFLPINVKNPKIFSLNNRKMVKASM